MVEYFALPKLMFKLKVLVWRGNKAVGGLLPPTQSYPESFRSICIFICCEIIRDLGVNGQLPRDERDERDERRDERERELKLTLTLPVTCGAVRQGWRN